MFPAVWCEYFTLRTSLFYCIDISIFYPEAAYETRHMWRIKYILHVPNLTVYVQCISERGMKSVRQGGEETPSKKNEMYRAE